MQRRPVADKIAQQPAGGGNARRILGGMLLPKYTRKQAALKMREHGMVIALIALVVIGSSLAYLWVLKAIFNYLVGFIFDTF